MGNCSSLQQLHLNNNTLLSGIIPPELSHLRQFTVLDLSYNRITGPIPESLVNCTLLETLDFTDNYLNGPILQELGSLRRLSTLHLELNYFNGSIPRMLGNLSSLSSLTIGGHPQAALGGNIPSELGKLKNLTYFTLYNSKITGSIPPELGNLTHLQQIFLWNNPGLVGTIPDSLGNLNKVYGFSLGANALSGTIPATLGSLRMVQGLDLQWNKLTGPIPPSFQNLTRIYEIYLSHNNLSGPLLPELGNLTTLGQIDFESNAFTGEVPSTFGKLSKLETVYLTGNRLSGAIPPAFFSAMANAIQCNLGYNNFSGSIAREIGDMVMMQFLDLSFNSLSGPVPETIRNCRPLYYLRLSNNHLTGELPVDALESLNLLTFTVANNSLEGRVPSPVGPFARFNSSVYVGNPGLCGPPLRMKCSNSTCSKISPTCHRGRFYHFIAAGLSVLVVVVVIAACCIQYWKTKSSKFEGNGPVLELSSAHDHTQGITLFIQDFSRSLTVEELRLATDGFSAASVIGLGGQYMVYKVVLAEPGVKTIAVKVLNASLLGQTALTNQLFNEVKVLANIRHRNLVGLYGFCANSEMKAVLVEFVSNGDLNLHLHPGRRIAAEKCKLSLETRLQIAIGVANALAYLHHECPVPVIHRDLKPANILLESDFNPKVSDFGISKLANPVYINEASASYLCGTIGYIPPEYASTYKVSTEGDVYSYGVVLLELLTGKSPTADSFKNEYTLVSWVSRASPDRIADILDDALVSELPSHEGEVQRLLRVGLQCTREDPKSRPSMRDVQEILTGAEDKGAAFLLSAYPTWEELADK